MPHLSKSEISENTKNEIEKRVLSFINDTSPRTRRALFSELLTKTERMMLAKRLSMIFLIDKRKTAYEISRILKVSDSTIFRFMKVMEKGAFKNTTVWLRKNSATLKILNIIADLAVIPYKARHQSLSDFLEKL
jgi:Trp operon repressor